MAARRPTGDQKTLAGNNDVVSPGQHASVRFFLQHFLQATHPGP